MIPFDEEQKEFIRKTIGEWYYMFTSDSINIIDLGFALKILKNDLFIENE